MTHRMQIGEGAPAHDHALDGLTDGIVTVEVGDSGGQQPASNQQRCQTALQRVHLHA